MSNEKHVFDAVELAFLGKNWDPSVKVPEQKENRTTPLLSHNQDADEPLKKTSDQKGKLYRIHKFFAMRSIKIDENISKKKSKFKDILRHIFIGLLIIGTLTILPAYFLQIPVLVAVIVGSLFGLCAFVANAGLLISFERNAVKKGEHFPEKSIFTSSALKKLLLIMLSCILILASVCFPLLIGIVGIIEAAPTVAISMYILGAIISFFAPPVLLSIHTVYAWNAQQINILRGKLSIFRDRFLSKYSYDININQKGDYWKKYPYVKHLMNEYKGGMKAIDKAGKSSVEVSKILALFVKYRLPITDIVQEIELNYQKGGLKEDFNRRMDNYLEAMDAVCVKSTNFRVEDRPKAVQWMWQLSQDWTPAKTKVFVRLLTEGYTVESDFLEKISENLEETETSYKKYLLEKKHLQSFPDQVQAQMLGGYNNAVKTLLTQLQGWKDADKNALFKDMKDLMGYIWAPDKTQILVGLINKRTTLNKEILEAVVQNRYVDKVEPMNLSEPTQSALSVNRNTFLRESNPSSSSKTQPPQVSTTTAIPASLGSVG